MIRDGIRNIHIGSSKMKPRSAKAKGRKLQNDIREQLLQTFPEIHPDNIKCSLMSETGEDIKMSYEARQRIPYSFEAKCQEKLNIWDALQQSAENAPDGITPAVVFKRNYSDTYVAIPFTHFLELIK